MGQLVAAPSQPCQNAPFGLSLKHPLMAVMAIPVFKFLWSITQKVRQQMAQAKQNR